MVYREFQGLRLSGLGMGCMRLPVRNGVYADIDETALGEMVDCAMAGGVNYYDTAYGYHDGRSEGALLRALRRYPRESWYLADKFPGYDLSNMDKVGAIFEEQLRRCGVDHFDFYLFHNVCEMNIEQYLDPRYGIFDYLLRQKQNGRIRHLGFSAHGSLAVIRRFLDAYGEQMEFCQLQLNWLDWDFQHAKDKVALLNEKKIPVWVMEPLRGGRLAKLPPEQTALLRGLQPDENTPAWAFRFLQSVPGVTVVLSGMSDLAQLQDNLRTFETEKPLTDRERQALLAIADGMTKRQLVPCTGCRYCTSHCPQELDIPSLLALYNEHRFSGGGFLAPMALSALPKDKQPGACLGCRSCEAVCPQGIKVSEALADFVRILGA